MDVFRKDKRKPLLHNQIFFDKFHVSSVFFDLVNQEFVTNFLKNFKTFDIRNSSKKIWLCKMGLRQEVDLFILRKFLMMIR